MKKMLGILLVFTISSLMVYAGSKAKVEKRKVAQVAEGEINCNDSNLSGIEASICLHEALDKRVEVLKNSIDEKCQKSQSYIDAEGGTAQPLILARCKLDLYSQLQQALLKMKTPTQD